MHVNQSDNLVDRYPPEGGALNKSPAAAVTQQNNLRIRVRVAKHQAIPRQHPSLLQASEKSV